MSIVCMIIVATLLYVVNLALYKLQYSSKIRSTQLLPPGPKPIPVFGCLIQMLRQKQSPSVWIHQLMQEMDTEIACIRLCGINVIPVTSPELAQEFLRKQDAVFATRPCCMSARIATLGYKTVFSSNGDHWKKMKRVLVTHVLSSAKHKLFHDQRMEEADNLVRYVLNLAKDGVMVNVRSVARHHCGNLTRRFLFNKRFFRQGPKNGGPGVEEEEHLDAIFTILKHIYGLSISDYAPWLEVFDLDGAGRSLARAVEKMSKYHDTEIEQRIKMWRNGMKQKEDDILDVLINLKDDDNHSPLLSVEEIRGELLEIMLTMIDNPSNAVEWALFEMIHQPDLLTKAQQEVDNVVGRNRLVQESDLPKLNYVKACAKEAFRLHPMVPFNVPHVSTQDTLVHGYFIPKGSEVLLSRHGLGRNPRVWKEPHRFMPERHIHNDGSEINLGDPELRMITFSTGRRSCPGMLFGSTMTVMLLARLVQGFEWSIPSNEIRISNPVESEMNVLLAKPLQALAKSRLNDDVYNQLAKSRLNDDVYNQL